MNNVYPAIISGCMRFSDFDRDGSNIKMTREEWYKLYMAAGHPQP